MLTDDDVRVPFGKASERAQDFVKHGMLNELLNLAKEYKNLKEIYLALSKLTIRNEFCKEILDCGGVEFLLKSLTDPENNASLLKSKISLIKAVSGNDDAKIEIAKQQGIEIIMTVLNRYMKNAPIAEIACSTLASVVLRQPNHSNIVMENGGAELITRVIAVHIENTIVLSSLCLLVRNLVSRVKEHSSALLERGIEQQLHMVSNKHEKCADSVKAALRDLGCHVSLKEEWKGEGRTLAR
ncbi:DgyrCDS3976 [Dimorphilus gyrociliatus]|uniref:DgyrCDS3976 n=1 Tax=Dimorphilus gyrociliatus TaxID=2664684 RepID=A0A7I8VHN7_9ANNE|nr:DgyrCDS3976 [Dimorphilus gyrociliatus]